MSKPRSWTAWGVGTILLGVVAYALAEDLTLTTYYPSPRGVYKELRTSGDVAIGTTSAPSARLQVVGGLSAPALYVVGSGGTTTLRVDDAPGGDATPFLIGSDGNVGLGTSSPGLRFDVADAGSGTRNMARLQNTQAAAPNTGAQLLFAAQRTTAGLTNVAGVAGLITDITAGAYKGALVVTTADNAAPAERLRVDHLGRVGIGTTTLTESLEVNGNIKLSGVTPTYTIANVVTPLSTSPGSNVATKDYVDAAAGGGGYFMMSCPWKDNDLDPLGWPNPCTPADCPLSATFVSNGGCVPTSAGISCNSGGTCWYAFTGYCYKVCK